VIGGTVAGRLLSDPIYESCHIRMRGEKFEGIELTLQSLLGKESVNVVVAGWTKPHDSSLNLGSVEFAFVALVGVPCSGD